MAVALLAVASGCGPALPEPDSPGAQTLVRCSQGCHGASAPGSMTLGMWEFQIERKRGEFARLGIPWLTPAEERALHEYLKAHAGTE